MQRLKRIKFGGEATMPLLKARSPALGRLERDRRNIIRDDLLLGQRDDADLNVEIEVALVEAVLDLAGDGQRHRLAGRVEVGDVEDTHGTAGCDGAVNDLDAGGRGQL